MSASLRDSLLSSPPEVVADLLAGMPDDEAAAFLYDWRTWARPEQLAPPDPDWFVWLILSGRGWGKTRTSAELVREWAQNPGWRIALVARTAADARDTLVEGESGVLAVSPPWFRPVYEPSKRRLTWPNGTIATTYSADEPDLLRGPQHHAAACDETASWKYADDTWSNLMFGLRLGSNPRVIVTTTPRPIPLIRELLADGTTRVTRGSTYDNAANLPAKVLAKYRAKYEGTRIGRQELHGEVLDDVPGALWQRAMIEAGRVKAAPPMKRIVVAIDPAVTSGEDSDETGIVAAGKGYDGEFYVLDDESCRESPDTWARRAVGLYTRRDADRIVAEVNNGGDLVEATLRTVNKHIPYTAVHASRGKRVRAEPIAALYEQGKVHHVGGFAELEDQMCTFTPDNIAENSPDRVDALVWALTELSEGSVPSFSGVPEDSRPHFPTRM